MYLKELEEKAYRDFYWTSFEPEKRVKKRGIKKVHIYSLAGGGYAIEAIIDGIKCGPKKLNKEDAINLNGKTDRIRLAEKYLIANEAY